VEQILHRDPALSVALQGVVEKESLRALKGKKRESRKRQVQVIFWDDNRGGGGEGRVR